MSNEAITQKIEALLFALGRPLTRTELAELLTVSADDVSAAITLLKKDTSRGVVVVDDGTQVELRAAGEAAALIEQIRKEEYSREIGRAGLEVLSAILYRGPLARTEIDFIRGVNSSQTLRTLTMRGLVRRVPSGSNARTLVYEPTTELLATLGVAHVSELPDYAAVRDKLTALEQAYHTINPPTAEQSS